VKLARSLPVPTSQNLIVPSQPPEANVLPSGENATDQALAVCAFIVARSLPVATSQSFTVPSSNPQASVLPSAANAPEGTAVFRPGFHSPSPLSG
jgi:hypothetical protein